ncbi:MAG: DUF1207 domain-containing protein [Gammaproteobacteria bacterium]
MSRRLWLVAIMLMSLLIYSRCLAASESWRLAYFPTDHLYAHYLANPLHSNFSFQYRHITHSAIPQTGDRRFALSIGGNLGLIRLHPVDQPQRGWQLSLEAGGRGEFDTTYSEDNIGWDGLYGLFLDYRHNHRLAYRLGMHHTSSHIGDEYAERTGWQRINYTRQEVRLAALWAFIEHGQTYLEIAHAYDRRNQVLQQPGRAEWGIQYKRDRLFQHYPGGYVALNISTYEENDWDTNTTLQAGIHWPAGERLWRLGLEYYDGRAQMGEFFLFNEKYISLGLWMDL